MRFDLGLQVGFPDESHELFGDLAILEQDEGRDGTDIVLGGNCSVLVDVYFSDAQFPGHFTGQLFEDGSNGFAGPAPGGPEIDQ